MLVDTTLDNNFTIHKCPSLVGAHPQPVELGADYVAQGAGQRGREAQTYAQVVGVGHDLGRHQVLTAMEIYEL